MRSKGKDKAPPPVSPNVAPMFLVADEVVAWARLTGEPITTMKITQMTLIMIKHKMIKVHPPMEAVRNVILPVAEASGVVIAPLPAAEPPPGRPPAFDPADLPDLDSL